MDSPKKILTIDGGGLRGVFAATIIEQMKEAARKSARGCFYGTTPVPFSPLHLPGA